MKRFDIIIVGAGPAGMSAAMAAGKMNSRVLLLDGADKIGKKILVTGNGKCNLTNAFQSLDCYRSEEPQLASKILQKFDYDRTHEFFQELGIYTRNKNGYIYPYNEQAVTVRESFEMYLNHNPWITVQTECKVQGIEITSRGYIIHTNGEKYVSSAVLLTTGGYAGQKIGCDGSGFTMAKALGHKLIQTYPALTALKSSAPFLKKVSGVRNQAKIQLFIDREMVKEEEGELQWTDYGISGVAIFQLSRFAIVAFEAGKKVSLSLDFMPDQAEDRLFDLLYQMKELCPYKTASQLILGILPMKLVPVVLREARVKDDCSVENMNKKEIACIVQAIKSFELRINGYMGYEKAQVTRGGVSLREVNERLESVYQPGLFFAGEILDVDGTCGGYNLQWAFSSGNVAGQAAGDYIQEMKRATKNRKDRGLC